MTGRPIDDAAARDPVGDRPTVAEMRGIFHDPDRPSSSDRSVEAIRWRVEHDYELAGRNEPEHDVRALLVEYARLADAIRTHRESTVTELTCCQDCRDAGKQPWLPERDRDLYAALDQENDRG